MNDLLVYVLFTFVVVMIIFTLAWRQDKRVK